MFVCMHNAGQFKDILQKQMILFQKVEYKGTRISCEARFVILFQVAEAYNMSIGVKQKIKETHKFTSRIWIFVFDFQECFILSDFFSGL